MLRAFFLGIGCYMILAGTQCLAVDRVFWRASAEPAPAPAAISFTAPASPKPKEFPPATWLSWCLLTSGTVVCLYSFTIPARLGKGGK